jgi:phenylacetate-CoA ligase
LSSIQGRDTDIVFTPGGNRLIVHFFTGILEHFPEIDSFQVIQEKQGEINIFLVPKTSISENTKQQIITEMKKKGIDELKVNIELVSQIPLSPAGKRRFIINRIGREEE